MKRVILILLLLFATILTACSDSPETAQITQETQSSIENSIYSSKPDVSENETTEETSQAESSQEKTAEPIKTSTRCYDSNDSLMWSHEWIRISDTDLSEICYDKDRNEVWKGEVILDEHNHTNKDYGYDPETGKLRNIYEYSYNDNNLTKEVITDASGNIRDITIYEYSDEKMIRESKYDSDNKLYESIEYEYGTNGKVSKELAYDENKDLVGYDVYEYNEQGLVSKILYYFYDGELLATDSYKYNENGEIIEESGYDNVDEVLDTHVTYEYDSDGREIAYYYEESGQLVDYRLTEYTGNSGKESMIKTSFYDGSGELQRYTVWESFYE